MTEIQRERARRVTLQCSLMLFIAGVLGAPVSEAATFHAIKSGGKILFLATVMVGSAHPRQGATVVLAWDPSPDPEIIGYNVYRSENLGTFSVPALNGSTLVSESTFTDSTGEWNRPYYYVVTAVNASGRESAPSATVQATPGLPLFSTLSEAVEAAPVSNPVTTLTMPVGAAVTTSVSGDGLRWFQVNGASYLWGFASDVPLSGDFDGDGQTDISVFRPSDGYWCVLTSTSGFSSYFAYQFGESTDTPVPDDYDSDGRTDIAVFRPSNGVRYILTSSSNFSSYTSY